MTSTRAYLEAMEQVLPKIKKLVIASKSNLDLTIVRKDENPATSNGASQK